MDHLNRSSSVLSVAIACALLAGCSSGGSQPTVTSTPPTGSNPPSNPTVPVEETFPTGLAVASPSDISSTPLVASVAHPDKLRFAADWGRALIRAIKEGDITQMAGLAADLLPISTAHAAAGDRLDLKVLSATVQQVLS